MEYLKNELIKIKKDGRSFLGIDGGNINAKIWFCGIEFGGSIKEMSEYYRSKFMDSYKSLNYNIPYRNDCPEKFLNSKYDRYLSALYNYIFNTDKLYDYDKKIIDKVMKNQIYFRKSRIFKLNLYPLAKKSTDWDPEIEKMFNISKEEYYGDKFEKRKIFIKELVNKFRPGIIICTAVKNSESKFVETFLNNERRIVYTWSYIEYKTDTKLVKKFKISEYFQDNTKLIIIPFPGLGKGNLNSYNDVKFLADHLRRNQLELFAG